ncbi:hypothetical protein G4B88_001081 [Cannabis sativa]|uniref:Glycosyltransferase n=1 Tax=Cannabis sativa TaxID=3483 RepID=A0A7J6DLL2_CANSA|nr:hypothetical protein G4B88_001081 [Cannabis sativa]
MAATSYLKDSSPSSVVVVMVPYLSQSHLNQLLQLAHLISSYHIPVHYVSSTLHTSQVKSRSLNPLQQLTKIHFHDFPLIPTLSSSPPNPGAGSGGTLLPCEATKFIREPVAALLRSLSSNIKRLVVVHDVLMTSIVNCVVSLPNVEAYSISCASVFSFFTNAFAAMGRNDIIPIKNYPPLESCYSSVFLDFIKTEMQEMKSQAGHLYNTCRAIEGTFLDHLVNGLINVNQGDKKKNKKTWAVGPLHQMAISKKFRDEDQWLLEWLDKQEQNSVLYLSFGTTTSFSEEQIEEITVGLEQSGVKFIWILKDGDKIHSFDNEKQVKRTELPNGFEERMREKGIGMVVREWVSQVEILGHKATGGFMSHCGWNSCMESISMEVPVVAWPMNYDQPLNALLLTEVLKVGLAVLEWKQSGELVTSSMISTSVKTLMFSEEGGDIRKRIGELGAEVRNSVAEGGVTRMEWDSFIAHITR